MSRRESAAALREPRRRMGLRCSFCRLTSPRKTNEQEYRHIKWKDPPGQAASHMPVPHVPEVSEQPQVRAAPPVRFKADDRTDGAKRSQHLRWTRKVNSGSGQRHQQVNQGHVKQTAGTPVQRASANREFPLIYAPGDFQWRPFRPIQDGRIDGHHRQEERVCSQRDDEKSEPFAAGAERCHQGVNLNVKVPLAVRNGQIWLAAADGSSQCCS